MGSDEESKAEQEAKGMAQRLLSTEIGAGVKGLAVGAALVLDSASITKVGQQPDKEKPVDEPVVTRHKIKIKGKTLAYTVTTGLMPINSETGEKEADIFFMAYTLDKPGDAAEPREARARDRVARGTRRRDGGA